LPTEFWRWREYAWASPDLDWHGARIVTAGVDVGSVSSQAVILADGVLIAYASARTGSDSPGSANDVMGKALVASGATLSDIHYTVGTGYGRVNVPFAQRAITEITCHAKGANFIYGPSVRTILDMGGQDCKAIRCDERGRVLSFLMNDKCAAGTGRGLEVIADLLSVPIEEMGELSLSPDTEPPPVSSTCVIFAKSEATALLRKGWPKESVLAAYSAAMAHRIVGLLRRLGVEPELAITGGIAKNVGIVRRVEKELGVVTLSAKYDPQIAGALGAAMLADSLARKVG
jgi:bzd-type benzoyl-CoA reductase Q subunit